MTSVVFQAFPATNALGIQKCVEVITYGLRLVLIPPPLQRRTPRSLAVSPPQHRLTHPDSCVHVAIPSVSFRRFCPTSIIVIRGGFRQLSKRHSVVSKGPHWGLPRLPKSSLVTATRWNFHPPAFVSALPSFTPKASLYRGQ